MPASEPEIHILKTAGCPNLSGGATLQYEVGCDAKQAIHIRITGNDGGGYFRPVWTALTAIQDVFSEVLPEAGITSYTLHCLYPGMSQNNPGFMLAALRHLQLVQPHKDKPRCYEPTDGKAFFEEIEKLLASKVAAQPVKEVAKGSGKKA
jgi:hypothetical protein